VRFPGRACHFLRGAPGSLNRHGRPEPEGQCRQPAEMLDLGKDMRRKPMACSDLRAPPSLIYNLQVFQDASHSFPEVIPIKQILTMRLAGPTTEGCLRPRGTNDGFPRSGTH
jgi:hypothetical protein